jgi:hypothetical protein
MQEDYLPSYLQSIMTTKSGSSCPKQLVTALAASSPTSRNQMIQGAIRHIVSRAAGRQTLVNLACVGVGKGFTYVLAKVMKRIKSSK